jgi:hypothetical protein
MIQAKKSVLSKIFLRKRGEKVREGRLRRRKLRGSPRKNGHTL